MRFPEQEIERQREGMHSCVDVSPLGYPRTIRDRLGEAGERSEYTS